MEYAKCSNCNYFKYDYYCERLKKVAPFKDKPTKCNQYKGKFKKKKKTKRKKIKPNESKIAISNMVIKDRNINKFDNLTRKTTS